MTLFSPFSGLAGHFCWFFLGLFPWLHVAEGTAGAGPSETAPKLVISLCVVFNPKRDHTVYFHRVAAAFQEVIPNVPHIFRCSNGKASYMFQCRVKTEGTSQEHYYLEV